VRVQPAQCGRLAVTRRRDDQAQCAVLPVHHAGSVSARQRPGKRGSG
jgi:hypothetical protein